MDQYNATLEFILFDRYWATKFRTYLESIGVPFKETIDADTILIHVPDDLSDETDALIEAEYDRIMTAHEAADTNVDEMNRVGIQYVDALGETRQARVDMVLVNRLMTVVTLDELQSFVQNIADEIAVGGDKRLCER